MSMRQPTPIADSLAFHRRALAGAREEIREQDPECGFWKMRLSKRGCWVPVWIWLEQEIGDDGELLRPEVLKCTVDGQEKDPREVWQWCSQRAIDEPEFRYLTALRSWQRINEPEAWDPYRPIDMTETAIEE
jgi:hypothetical protein